jgi:DNA gyrase subunit A
MLATKHGMAIRFNEEDVRAMGRSATGVKGITLEEGDEVVSLEILRPDAPTLLTVCANGYGKRTELSEYRDQSRGGKGIITIKTSERNGSVVGALTVHETDEVMLTTDQGTMIRMKVDEVRIAGRNTQGVRLINVGEGENVTSITRIAQEDEAVVPPEGGETPPSEPAAE